MWWTTYSKVLEYLILAAITQEFSILIQAKQTIKQDRFEKSDKRMKQQNTKLPPYRRSSWMILHIANPLTKFFVGRLGLGGSSGIRILRVKGRKSGKWHSTPIRLLELDGKRYLVALQGETFWVKNIRSQGGGQLLFGGKTIDFKCVEVPDKDKLPILRAFLKRWWSVSKPLTPITSPEAPDEEFIKAEPLHPTFLLL